MSESDQSSTRPQPEITSVAHPTGAPPEGAILDSPVASKDSPKVAADDSTVGTGTSIALGCVLGTIVLIIFGLIFIGIVALIN